LAYTKLMALKLIHQDWK